MSSIDASTTRDSGKTAPESGHHPPPPLVNFFGVDFVLRFFLFASTISALIVMVTSKQTKLIPTSLSPPFPAYVSRAAKFDHSPAFIYMVVALAVTCFYSIITMFTSAFVISNPFPSTKMLFNMILFDALMAGIMASATGATGGVAYIGLKGNSHVNWNKICNFYDKFCRHIGASALVSLIASIILVILVIISSYSLYRRSR
ncbi:CASP-like protein 1D1 [Dioscorea cayenensis subsp. rotundata]|uniref:CASP-like protein n=1 Tax=Dioscorea cayennensis subsp. rotundata TaxID=55577 RepID=A0AB40BJT2_DIOCR|nr:CASP-like protein 1D1 [Dioscorea cayenensis subsp. rotundata]